MSGETADVRALFTYSRCPVRNIFIVCFVMWLAWQGDAAAAGYPISGAWTVAPSNSRQIADVRRACQAYRHNQNLEKRASAGRLIVFKSNVSTHYDRSGTRTCQNLMSTAVGKKSFHLVDLCEYASGHEKKRESYKLRRLNSLQVFITPDGGSTTYELIGCP
jgi:hypothetical protein